MVVTICRTETMPARRSSSIPGAAFIDAVDSRPHAVGTTPSDFDLSPTVSTQTPNEPNLPPSGSILRDTTPVALPPAVKSRDERCRHSRTHNPDRDDPL